MPEKRLKMGIFLVEVYVLYRGLQYILFFAREPSHEL